MTQTEKEMLMADLWRLIRGFVSCKNRRKAANQLLLLMSHFNIVPHANSTECKELFEAANGKL